MEFRNNPNADTLAEIEKTCQYIRDRAPQLSEQAGSSQWSDGHVVFVDPVSTPDQYIYMIGALKNGKVTWHMMPMYGVSEIKERWSDTLQPFVSGKSCIQFKAFDELPTDALDDIVRNGTPAFQQVLAAMKKKKR